MKKEIKTVDHYISEFQKDTREKLQLMRRLIMENASTAVESISYGMPAYKLNNKPLVYFGGFSKHIGFYALPSGHKNFKIQLSNYKQGKGSVQFPIDQPLPVDLIVQIVKFRVSENLKK